MTILVTGGCGFIGSNFIINYLNSIDEDVINLDLLTYAGNPETLSGMARTIGNRYKFICGNIADSVVVSRILEQYRPRVIFNFAAESHVDNSINSSIPFVQTNVLGTVNILECIKKYNKPIKLVQVSTDEVFGSLNEDSPAFNHNTPYAPRSPYSASKAASDHFVMSYHHTYGLDTVITNCSNNYGRYQHPEKFIPTVILSALAGKQVPIYGSGKNIRDWIYVIDHCKGILKAAEHGSPGSRHLFGGDNQISNIDLAKKILQILDLPEDRISFVQDRKGHDFRYDIDNRTSKVILNWKPEHSFDDELKETVKWYRNNLKWVESCQRNR